MPCNEVVSSFVIEKHSFKKFKLRAVKITLRFGPTLGLLMAKSKKGIVIDDV